MVECPSISETIFGFTLRVSSVAHVCLRSWKRISGSPTRFSSGLNERRARLWRLMGSPVSEAKMGRSRSSGSLPDLSPQAGAPGGF